MTSPYDAVTRLASMAARVRGRAWTSLPPLLALTDPDRQPDPVALAELLPPGSGLVFRHFGAPDRADQAMQARETTSRRGVCFLVSADPELARRCGADGIHWPEHDLPSAARARARGDTRLFTASAHSPRALRCAASAGIDAALVSTVFPSASPSSGRAMGPFAVAAWARQSQVPVYALGGINPHTISRLNGLGISGVAVVGAIRSAGPTRT
ncbi:thiamine phosphate synthase [Maricaulis sp.]|uniref:thiamine phosphate synthase n=1 Tax=Maricaulis sp. TaxID=1486257 RepID=UPI0025C0BC81|nr:thiamine phosphate synthase [Maricaulis sp.]